MRSMLPTRLEELIASGLFSPGSINGPLSGHVRIARDLERTESLHQAANCKRCIVLVTVYHPAEAEYVRTIFCRP